MINYSQILVAKYPTTEWVLLNNYDYSTLEWLSDTPKPTKATLDALWPEVDYTNQVTQVETNRRIAYETYSDGIFYEWQRGDNTEAAWREAVAKVKTENPYPPEP